MAPNELIFSPQTWSIVANFQPYLKATHCPLFWHIMTEGVYTIVVKKILGINYIYSYLSIYGIHQCVYNSHMISSTKMAKHVHIANMVADNFKIIQFY